MPPYRAVSGLRDGRLSHGDPERDLLCDLVPAALIGSETEHLLVVPDGVLHRVPFAALPLPDGADLISRYTLSHVPSLSSLRRDRNHREPAGVEVVVIADPDVGDAALPEHQSDQLRGWADALPRLPWAAREAEIIADLFDSDVTLKLTGEYATRNPCWVRCSDGQRCFTSLRMATSRRTARTTSGSCSLPKVNKAAL